MRVPIQVILKLRNPIGPYLNQAPVLGVTHSTSGDVIAHVHVADLLLDDVVAHSVELNR
jgi:hypothetical protein